MKEREIWLCIKDNEAFQDRKDKHLSGKACPLAPRYQGSGRARWVWTSSPEGHPETLDLSVEIPSPVPAPAPAVDPC